MLRHVYESDGVIAVFGEVAFQVLSPLFNAYTQAMWRWHCWQRHFCVTIEGCRLTLLPEDKGVSIELAVHGTHEPRATQLLAQCLRPGMTVVDIGSNLGYYALLESGCVGPQGRIIAIEPVPRNAELCKYNISINGCSNVLFQQTAISDHNGVATLHLSDKSNWHTLNPLPGPTTDVFVRACTLDSLVGELSLQRVDLVRMDLEGYEVRVVDGMRKTIELYGPRLLVEMHPHIVGSDKMRQYLSELKDVGYSPEWLLDQERDIPWRWHFLNPETLSMDKLIADWRVNIHPRSLTVMFAKKHAHKTDLCVAPAMQAPAVNTQTKGSDVGSSVA